MQNAGLDEAQAGIKIAKRNINNLRYADDTTLMAESEEELKSLLMKVKEKSENVDLKLNIQETKIMASGSIISWQIDGETVETVTDFVFLGSKITVGGDWSHEIKRCLLLGRKVDQKYDQSRQHIKKQRYLPINVCLVKVLVVLVVMYGCESWTIKKAKHWRIDAFEHQLVVLEKALESPLDCKIQPVHPKGNKFWIFIGITDAVAETPILWPSDGKTWLICIYPDAGKDWRCKEKGEVGWHHWLNGHWAWVASGSWWWTGRPGVLQSMGSQRVGHYWATELNWADLRTLNTESFMQSKCRCGKSQALLTSSSYKPTCIWISY